MNDKIKDLKRQLAEAESEERLHNQIRKARCPLCGSTLVFSAKDGPPHDYAEYTTTAEVKCPSCECFGYREEVHQSHYDRTTIKPLELLGSVWLRVSQYVKHTNKTHKQ